MKRKWTVIAIVALTLMSVSAGILLSCGRTTIPTSTPPAPPVTTQELITKAQRGDYQEGTETTIRVSGTYKERYFNGYFYFCLEQPYAGFYVAIEVPQTSSDVTAFSKLKKGDRVVFEGSYGGFKKIGWSNDINAVILLYCHLISVG